MYVQVPGEGVGSDTHPMTLLGYAGFPLPTCPEGECRAPAGDIANPIHKLQGLGLGLQAQFPVEYLAELLEEPHGYVRPALGCFEPD